MKKKISQFPHEAEKKLRKIFNFNTKKILDRLKTEDLDEVEFTTEEKKKMIQDLSEVVFITNKKIFESWRTLTDEELKRDDLTGAKYWIKENYLRINNIQKVFKKQLDTFKQEHVKSTLEKFNASLDFRFSKLLKKRKLSQTDVDKLLTELKGFYRPSQEIKNLIFELESNKTLSPTDVRKLKEWANRRNELWARNETGNLYAEELKSLWSENGIDKYVWRTMQDNRVRPEHIEKDGKIFSVNEGILPGQDFGCRCWAEAVDRRK